MKTTRRTLNALTALCLLGCTTLAWSDTLDTIKQRKKIIVCENCGRILVDNELNDGVEVK